MSATKPALPGGPLDAAFRDGRRQRLRPGAVLFSEGDVSNRVVLLLSGRVKVSSFSEDGQETVLGFRGAGNVLGELSAIDGGEHSTTVSVVEPGEAIVVPADRFLAALRDHARSRARAVALIVGRLRDADRKRVEFRRSTWRGGWPTGWWSWPTTTGSRPRTGSGSACRSPSASWPAGSAPRARP